MWLTCVRLCPTLGGASYTLRVCLNKKGEEPAYSPLCDVLRLLAVRLAPTSPRCPCAPRGANGGGGACTGTAVCQRQGRAARPGGNLRGVARKTASPAPNGCLFVELQHLDKTNARHDRSFKSTKRMHHTAHSAKQQHTKKNKRTRPGQAQAIHTTRYGQRRRRKETHVHIGYPSSEEQRQGQTYAQHARTQTHRHKDKHTLKTHKLRGTA